MTSKYHRIELLHKIIETGSISETSRLMKSAQPNVSRALADFEKKLGFVLFNRQGNKVVPTKEALILYRETQGFMSKIESMDILIGQLAKGYNQYLKIAMTPLASYSLWPNFYQKFQKIGANYIFDCKVVDEKEILKDLYSNEFDLIFTTKLIQSNEVKSIRIFNTKLGLLHANLTDKQTIKHEDILDFKIFKNHISDSQNLALNNQFLFEINYSPASIICYDYFQLINQIILEKACVISNDGAAIGFEQQFSDKLSFSIFEPLISFDFYLNYLSSSADEPLIVRFAHLLLATD